MNNFENIDVVKNKFNWGAFLLTWIWGIYNKSLSPILLVPILFIPKVGTLIYFFLSIWFGKKGNEWALKNKSFHSVDDFNEYQKKFVYVTLTISVINIILILILELLLHKNPELIVYLYSLVIGFNIFILICGLIYLIYEYRTLKIVLVSISSIIFLFFSISPCLNFQAYYYRKNNDFTKAISTYKKILTMHNKDSILKMNYYQEIAHCYLSLKDVNSAIQYFEKANKNMIYNFENETLSNLYIVNKDYDNAIRVGGKYKICALQDNWECVLSETTYRIDNAKSKIQPFKEKEFIPNDESAFSYRAVAYKNLGDLNSAEQDYDIVLKLVQSKELQERFKAFYSSNGLTYKQFIEKQRKLYNIEK